MAWWQTNDKPLLDPSRTQLTEVYSYIHVYMFIHIKYLYLPCRQWTETYSHVSFIQQDNIYLPELVQPWILLNFVETKLVNPMPIKAEM